MRDPAPPLRDPRLAELQLLADLEGGNKQVHFSEEAPSEKTYGLGASAFSDLVIHLLLDGVVNGPSALSSAGGLGTGTITEGETPIDDLVQGLLAEHLGDVFKKKWVWLHLNHKGRLRLWGLRDELLSRRKLEPFGILRAREDWERDLDLGFIFMPPGSVLSVVFCDVDHFKDVNDKLGHAAGDEALKFCFQTIKDTVERVGEAYRYGGDEVVILLPNVGEEKARLLAEEIRGRVEANFPAGEKYAALTSRPTLSIGSATFTVRCDPNAATRAADSLVYQSKREGRNRVTARTYTSPPPADPDPIVPARHSTA